MDLFTDQYFFFSFFLKTKQKKFNILFSCQLAVIPVFVLRRLLVCSVSHSAVVESVDSNGTAVSSLPPRSPPTGPRLMVRKTLEYLRQRSHCKCKAKFGLEKLCLLTSQRGVVESNEKLIRSGLYYKIMYCSTRNLFLVPTNNAQFLGNF